MNCRSVLTETELGELNDLNVKLVHQISTMHLERTLGIKECVNAVVNGVCSFWAEML